MGASLDSRVQISREWRFLLAATKLAPSSRDLALIEKAVTEPLLDWDRVVKLALEQDIAPLVHSALQRMGTGRDAIPSARAKLENAYFGNAIRNELLFQELGNVLAAICKAGKPVVILKGAALADTVYKNRALRPMSDVDLLVRLSDVPAIKDLLLAMGYLNEQHENTKAWCSEFDYHFAFRKQLNRSLKACVEIHWHLESAARPQRIDIDGIWDRAVSAEAAHAPALQLSVEDLLLYLCLHTCKHRLNGGFRAFCDISEVVRIYGQTMDREQVCTRALQWRIETFVYAALHIARELLDAPVPQRLFGGLRHPIDTELLQIATAAVLEDRLSAALFSDFFQLERGQGVRARTEVFRKLFSPAVLADRYGLSTTSTRIYWYYPVRVKDLAFRYAPELFRFLRRGSRVIAQKEDKSRLADWLEPLTTHHQEPPKDPRG